MAESAESTRFQVNIFCVCGGVHDAILRLAVNQPVDVPQLVQSLFFKPGGKQGSVRRKAVPFGREPVIRNNGDFSAELRFPEDKRQDRDEQVLRHDRKNPCTFRMSGKDRIPLGKEMSKDRRGIVLHAMLIIELLQVNVNCADLDRGLKCPSERGAEIRDQAWICTPERQKVD